MDEKNTVTESIEGDKKGRAVLAGSPVRMLSTIVFQILSKFFEIILGVARIFIILLLLFFKIVNKVIRSFMIYVPKIVGSIIPKKRLVTMDQKLVYAGVKMTSTEIIGLTMVYGAAISSISFLLSYLILNSIPLTLIATILSFTAVMIIPYIMISILTEKRSESVEGVLPDVLSMVAQNMLAGMTSYNALWTAARPEFGPLAVEVQNVARSTLTGIPLTDALVGMTNRISSDKLARTVRLIVQGMKAGGDLPSVLQGISRDMRTENNLKKRMASETNAHVIFILFALIIGAPMLFAVSHEFISIFSMMMDRIDVSSLKEAAAQQSMIKLSELSITPEFFQIYAVAILSVSATFGALLVGILRTGKAISGVPSIPMFAAIAVGIFLIMKFALNSFFGSMFTF